MALQVVLRGKGTTTLHSWTVPNAGSAPSLAPGTVLPEAELAEFSADGSTLALVTGSGVRLCSGAALEVCRELPMRTPVALSFSPNGQYLVTWQRKLADEPNLCVFRVSTGELVAEFHQRVFTQESWPSVSWSEDGVIAIRLHPDGVHVFSGDFATATPIAKLSVERIKACWMAPGKAPYSIATFTPRTKSRPGALCLWQYPQLASPVSVKTLEADEARVAFASDGSAALVEMSTNSSEGSYYGDSRIFLLSKDGKVSIAVPGLKDGAVHDFAWSPKADSFVVIAGRSPPMATLHAKGGAATFSFGTGPFNTVRFSPHGRFLLLGGFGNMSGDVQLWDVNKLKSLAPTFNCPCTVTTQWSPDGRYVMMATTRPRLQVDNGYRVYSHRGVLVQHSLVEPLFGALWKPAPAGTYPDRAASPAPATGSSAAAAAVAPVPQGPAAASVAGAYVPPHLRNAGGRNFVSELMKADHKVAGVVKPSAAVAQQQSGVPVGGALARSELSASQKKRAKEHEKKVAAAAAAAAAAEAAAAVAAATAAATASGAAENGGGGQESDPEKQAKKLEKKLRQIADLEAMQKRGERLNEEQAGKIASKGDLLTQLESLRIK